MIIKVIAGITSSKHSINSDVGIGSSEQLFFFDCIMVRLTSSFVNNLKESSFEEEYGSSADKGFVLPMLFKSKFDLITLILSLKKSEQEGNAQMSHKKL